MLAQVVNGDDVAVRQLAGGPRLAEEPLAQVGIAFDRARDDLDRDDTLEKRVEGPVHDAHATLAELFAQFVAADAFHQEWIFELTADFSGVWAEDIMGPTPIMIAQTRALRLRRDPSRKHPLQVVERRLPPILPDLEGLGILDFLSALGSI